MQFEIILKLWKNRRKFAYLRSPVTINHNLSKKSAGVAFGPEMLESRNSTGVFAVARTYYLHFVLKNYLHLKQRIPRKKKLINLGGLGGTQCVIRLSSLCVSACQHANASISRSYMQIHLSRELPRKEHQ